MPVSTTSTRNVMCSDAISLFLWFSGGETTTTTYEFANMCVCVFYYYLRGRCSRWVMGCFKRGYSAGYSFLQERLAENERVGICVILGNGSEFYILMEELILLAVDILDGRADADMLYERVSRCIEGRLRLAT